jgi:hypothetical protein
MVSDSFRDILRRAQAACQGNSMLCKGFDIETIEDEPGKFKAVIRKPSGGTVRTAVPLGPEVPAITTHLYAKADDAIEQAKRSIDAGGII